MPMQHLGWEIEDVAAAKNCPNDRILIQRDGRGWLIASVDCGRYCMGYRSGPDGTPVEDRHDTEDSVAKRVLDMWTGYYESQPRR